MNLYTDLLKSKRFSKKIQQKLMKYSQEYRTLATLRFLFPNKFDTMIIGDSPDLQDSINELGIEVTVAAQESDMKASHAFSELSKEDLDGKINIIKKIELCGYSLECSPFFPKKLLGSGTSNKEKICFQESIRRKKTKYEIYKSKFDKLGLAILLIEIPTTEAENSYPTWITEMFKDEQLSFNYVFVISHRFCISFDIDKNYFTKNCISCEDNQFLCTIARMTAEGELSLNDEEWN